jgi:hypothetical protein
MPYTPKLVNDTFGNAALTSAVGLGDLWDEVGRVAEQVGRVASGIASAAPGVRQVVQGRAIVAIAPKRGPSTILPVPGQPYGVAIPAQVTGLLVPVGIGLLAYFLLVRRR